jgi:hypothetical protein
MFLAHLTIRILRAMFEICLKRGWAVPAKAALNLCKMVEKRMFVYYLRDLYIAFTFSSLGGLR